MRNDLIASSKQASFLIHRPEGYHAYTYRCINTGRTCDGYSQPKHGYQTRIISYALDLSKVLHSPIAPSSGYDNVHYLEFYYYCVGPMLSGRFDTDFWCGIVLQMAHAEPAVRNAMIALAHLNQRLQDSLTHARHYTVTKDPESNQQFGLHYNKAIRCLIARMAEASYAPETGLVTCLLFACIEFLRAETQNALIHMRNGLSIVSELRRNHSVGSSPSSLSRPTLIRNGVSGPLDMIEKTLVPVFTQGLISALLYGIDVDTEFAFLDSPLELWHMRDFTSLREARFAYCELRNASILLARDMAVKIFQALPPSKPELERQAHILACHRAWLKALLAFENATNMSEEDRLDTSALKIGYYATYTATAGVHDARQMTFDAHLDSFKAIVYHATLLVNAMDVATRLQPQGGCSDAAANFTFDTSLVPALYYTALRCRHPTTRREAIALLSRKLPREGLWDPHQYRIIAERVVEIEESEVDDKGWPVERTRLWSGTVTPDANEKSGFRTDFLFAKDVGKGIGKAWRGRVGSDEVEENKVPTVAEMYVEVPVLQVLDD